MMTSNAVLYMLWFLLGLTFDDVIMACQLVYIRPGMHFKYS